ncbi:MAG TPA: OmpH family outer membrane protein, partial [Phycisphaerales bacterium]|nr:OmpH family outer membrane protein [Phycisphaerales bacterium]
MARATGLVLAAGIAGAVAASVLQHAVSLPARAAGQEASGIAADAARVGTVDVLRLLETMLETPEYADARNAAGDVWNTQITPLGDELNQLRQSITNMDPNDPAAQGLYQQFQSVQQRIGSLQQDAGQAMDKMSAEQLADAYRKIHGAVTSVAEAQGIDRVFSSRTTVDDINTENTNVVVQEVLLRPVLRNVPELDLTEAVRLELGLPELGAQPEKPEGPAEGVEQPIEQPQEQ